MARRMEQSPVVRNTVQSIEDQSTTEIDLVALGMRMLEKIHWILLAAFVCAAAAGAYVFFMVTPIYEATSKIYIVGSETAISLSDLQIGSNLAADYQEVFKNWHVHELVDQKLGLDYPYSKLAGMLTVTNPANTHVLYIKVQSPDPREAKLIADTYAEVSREFIAAKMDIREPNVFEEAKLPTAPISPQKTRTVLIGFLLGALLAMAAVTIRFISDDRICTSDDIAKVGNLPTLGMVPVESMMAGGTGKTDAESGQGQKKRGKAE